jgi:hypothetical protein
MRREKTQINKIINENGDITTNTNEIQRIIKVYSKNLHLNKLENPEEMDKFLDTFDQPKLNKEGINYLNVFITTMKLKQQYSLPKEKRSESDGFTAEFCKIFKEELIPALLKYFHEIEREGILLHSFYEDSITFIPKLDRVTTKKRELTIRRG